MQANPEERQITSDEGAIGAGRSPEEVNAQRHKGPLLIFKREVNVQPGSNYLSPFEALLKNKPDNTWLIRESCLEGRISVTYKKDGHIDHQRYAFVPRTILGMKRSGGSWELNNNPDEKLTIVPLNKDSIETKCDELLKRIDQDLKLNIEQVIIPSPEQRTANARYSGYVRTVPSYIVIANQLDRVYANPVAKLKEVDTIIAREETVIEPAKLSLTRHQLEKQMELSSPFTKGPCTKELKEFADSFENTLENLNVAEGLICPVTQSLYKEPYLLSSGHVIDREGLFYTDRNGNAQRVKECPLTRAPLTAHPPRVKGYDEALKHSLVTYHTKIALTQQQAQKKETRDKANFVAEQGASSSASAPKAVVSPLFREQVDQATSSSSAGRLFKSEKKASKEKSQKDNIEVTYL